MHTYLGTVLIAFSTLALEVALSRLLSVVAWYHLAFFAVSTAMLGMTAGATTVYLRPGWFTPERLLNSVGRACSCYALAVPVGLVILCLVPIELRMDARRFAMGLASLAFGTLGCALPFYFAGVAVSAALTRTRLPIGRLYAADLLGASGGCLFVLWALSQLSAPSCILLCAVLGALAGLVYLLGDQSSSRRGAWRFGVFALVSVACLFVLNASTQYGIRPTIVKGRFEDPREIDIERWNSLSRVAVFRQITAPGQLWARSPRTPPNQSVQRHVNIDGDAATTLRRFESPEDVAHLGYDLTAVAYHLRDRGGAAIIGVGGGRDVQTAISFGHERVLGVDVNPIFIELAQNEFRDFEGIADKPHVRLVVDEARSYLSRSDEQFALIQMSLIDTWAATGVGAFSLSENALYTVEAWKVFLSHLTPNGVFTVSRWYSPERLLETGRVMSLATAALFDTGISAPAEHLAMLTSGTVSTLLVARSQFTAPDVAAINSIAERLGFEVQLLPGKLPKSDVLRAILSAHDRRDLETKITGFPFNYSPPTDENPYFFNMLRLGGLSEALNDEVFFVIRGNLEATITLLGLIGTLLLAAIVSIVAPLRWLTPAGGAPASVPSSASIAYFCLIGAGFMCIEIAMMQRLSIFLGHPVYGLSVLLFAIILSTGLGALASERFELSSPARVTTLPVIAAAAAILLDVVARQLLSHAITLPTWQKIVLSVVAIVPLGCVLGFFFPVGMRLVHRLRAAESPWYWALNGIFGVLFSALAVFVSIYVSVSANYYLGSLCYLGLIPCVRAMWRTHASALPSPR